MKKTWLQSASHCHLMGFTMVSWDLRWRTPALKITDATGILLNVYSTYTFHSIWSLAWGNRYTILWGKCEEAWVIKRLTWGWQSFVCQDKLKNQKRKHLGMMYLENIHVKRKPCPIESWPSLLPTTCQDFCDRPGITDQQTCLGRRCQCCPRAGKEQQWHDIP